MARKLIALAMAAALPAGCGGASDTGNEGAASDAAVPADAVAPRPVVTTVPLPSASPAATPEPTPALDTGALGERRDPDRVLRFYAEALRARDWAAAARVWGNGSGVTAATLKAAYDRDEAPVLVPAKGTVEGAAGSLYYQAPVTLQFGPTGALQTGSLVLRRVNDVPGATADQLRWHIEQSLIGAAASAKKP